MKALSSTRGGSYWTLGKIRLPREVVGSRALRLFKNCGVHTPSTANRIVPRSHCVSPNPCFNQRGTPAQWAPCSTRTGSPDRARKERCEGCHNHSSKSERVSSGTALPFGLIHASPNAQLRSGVQKLHFCLGSLHLTQLAQQLSALRGKTN